MYSIKKVSQLLGIPAVTIRAWEKRYQVIHPVRSSGGHRSYSETDIETLRWIKHQVDEKGMKISEAALLLKQQAVEFRHENTDQKTYHDVMETLYENLVNMKTFESHKTIDFAFSMFHYNDVFHHVLAPVLYRIGEDWENGGITVAQEHFSSQIIMQRCSQFMWSLPIQTHLPRVLAFCPEGEEHQMGLMLFSLFLRTKGLDVTYLGSNTPLQDLLAVIKMKNISLVAASVSNFQLIETLKQWISSCRQEQKNIKFVLGGTGFIHAQSEYPFSSYVLGGDQADWERWYRATIKE